MLKERMISYHPVTVGRIHNVFYCDDKSKLRFFSKLKRNDETGCIEWINPVKARYPMFGLKNKIQVKAHRYAYFLQNGEFDVNKWVLHKCDNTKCCNPDHLYLGDAKQNAFDRTSRGREGDRSGIKNGRSKINDGSAYIIKNMLKGKSHKFVSDLYGVTPEMVSNIRRGLNWKHIKNIGESLAI